MIARALIVVMAGIVATPTAARAALGLTPERELELFAAWGAGVVELNNEKPRWVTDALWSMFPVPSLDEEPRRYSERRSAFVPWLRYERHQPIHPRHTLLAACTKFRRGSLYVDVDDVLLRYDTSFEQSGETLAMTGEATAHRDVLVPLSLSLTAERKAGARCATVHVADDGSVRLADEKVAVVAPAAPKGEAVRFGSHADAIAFAQSIDANAATQGEEMRAILVGATLATNVGLRRSALRALDKLLDLHIVFDIQFNGGLGTRQIRWTRAAAVDADHSLAITLVDDKLGVALHLLFAREVAAARDGTPPGGVAPERQTDRYALASAQGYVESAGEVAAALIRAKTPAVWYSVDGASPKRAPTPTRAPVPTGPCTADAEELTWLTQALLSSQEAHRAEHDTYSKKPEDITFRPPDGVKMKISVATRDRFVADLSRGRARVRITEKGEPLIMADQCTP